MRVSNKVYIEDLINICKEYPKMNVNQIEIDYFHVNEEIRKANTPVRFCQNFTNVTHVSLKSDILDKSGLFT